MPGSPRTEEQQQIDLHVGKRLRRRRRLLGLTQQELGEKVGIRFQQIQKYEAGANRVSASRLFELSEALSVPIQYFYEGLRDDDELDPLGDFADTITTAEARLVRNFRAASTEGQHHIAGVAKLAADANKAGADQEGGPQGGTSQG